MARDASFTAALVAMPILVPAPPPAPVPAAPSPCQTCRDDKLDRRLDAIEEAIEAQALTIELLKKKIAVLEKRNPMDLTFALSTGAFLTANLTSTVGAGAWFGGEVRSGPISLGLELRTVVPARVEVGPNDFDLSRYMGLLTPCGRVSYFFGCGVFGAGAELVYDSNAPGNDPGRISRTGLGPILQVGGRLGAELPFGESSFGGRAWGEVLYGAPSAHVAYPDTSSWTRPDVSAFFGIGLVWIFGKEGT